MSRRSEEQLSPRNGECLMVMNVCRISGCQKQKELSLEDQNDNAKEEIADRYEGKYKIDSIATKGKGEDLTRAEVGEIERLYKSGKYDVFIYDDLSRLIRGGEATRLLGVGVDHGVRSICIADGIDTADETWEEDALNACSENVAHNQRTSKRIKQKTMNRFKKMGATAKRPISGYIVPEDATSYDDWKKNSSYEEIILKGKRLLRETLNGEAVAEQFNCSNFPVGPMARNSKWDGTMVLRFYRNPILKGYPQRGKMVKVKIHGSGKRVSKKNPKGPTYYAAPHLAFLDPTEFDELIELLEKKNKNRSRVARRNVDPRLNTPRKRTRAFGQHARCWYCGHTCVWGGNGITDNLMCSASRKWNCWNSIGFPGPFAAKLVARSICDRLLQLDDIDTQFRAMVEQTQGGMGGFNIRSRELGEAFKLLERDRSKVKEAVLKYGTSDFLGEMLAEIGIREKDLIRKQKLLELESRTAPVLPASTSHLRSLLLDEFQRLAIESADFGDWIHKLVPEVYVYLVRLCDGGHLLPRAKMRFNLLGGFPDAARSAELVNLLSWEQTFDLFIPPDREKIRLQTVSLAAQGLKQREIAAHLSGNFTQTAVWQAIELQRTMDAAGLQDPYVFVPEPPADYKKLRRHKNGKYAFEPLEGYIRAPV